jgi:hypothetical protein
VFCAEVSVLRSDEAAWKKGVFTEKSLVSQCRSIFSTQSGGFCLSLLVALGYFFPWIAEQAEVCDQIGRQRKLDNRRFQGKAREDAATPAGVFNYRFGSERRCLRTFSQRPKR